MATLMGKKKLFGFWIASKTHKSSSFCASTYACTTFLNFPSIHKPRVNDAHTQDTLHTLFYVYFAFMSQNSRLLACFFSGPKGKTPKNWVPYGTWEKELPSSNWVYTFFPRFPRSPPSRKIIRRRLHNACCRGKELKLDEAHLSTFLSAIMMLISGWADSFTSSSPTSLGHFGSIAISPTPAIKSSESSQSSSTWKNKLTSPTMALTSLVGSFSNTSLRRMMKVNLRGSATLKVGQSVIRARKMVEVTIVSHEGGATRCNHICEAVCS